MANYSPFQLLTPPQLRAQVRGQIQPYLNSGARAISGYTDALARALAPAAGQTQANYLHAQQQQASVDQALANRFTGVGGGVQNDLATQLAQAGQSTAPAQGIGQVASGAANAGYAQGSASLSQLLSQGAAAQQYAGQLPNIARLGGAQQQQQYRQQILSGLPKLMQAAQAQEFQKALAVQSGLISGAKLQQSASQFQGRQQTANATLAERTRHDLATENAKIVANDISKYRSRHHLTGGLSQAALSKATANSIEAVKALKHNQPNPNYNPTSATWHNGIPDTQQFKVKQKDFKPKTALGAYQYLVNHGAPPSVAASAVGKVYGKWLSPGDKKRLGIR